MDENEKIEYFNVFTENVFELIESNNDLKLVYNECIEHYGRLPKSLYRYVKLNDYTFDAIENDYIYLSSIEKLDDDFEGVVNSDYKNIEDIKDLFLTEKYHSYFIETLLRKNGIYEQYASTIFQNSGIRDGMDLYYAAKYIFEDHKTDFDGLNSILSLISGYVKESDLIKRMAEIANKIMNSKKDAGVCCFTDIKNSQVMWNMYGDNYKGCIIEYDISPFDLLTTIDLSPVLYTNEREHDPLKMTIDILVNTYDKTTKDVQLETIRKKYKIVLSKNKEWSFQNEWRIIGKAGKQNNSPIIRAIYLGKNVNNDDKERVLKLAEERLFEVYEQDFDNDLLHIVYRRIENVPSVLTDKIEFYKRNNNLSDIPLTYDEYESCLYAIKLQNSLVGEGEEPHFICQDGNCTFSIMTLINNSHKLYDVKYWREVPTIEELKAVLGDIHKKLEVFNTTENKNVEYLHLIIVGRLFVLRTIQANIKRFCKVNNAVIKYYEERSLREIEELG